jgi:PIN domain nuclease of toxin-antitoxin system
MKLLLDTCCIIWAISQPSAISKTSKKFLIAGESEIHVSVISVAEIACAVDRGRIVIDRHWKKWFRHFINLNDWQVDSIDLDIMEEAYSLPETFHADPADRIITATSRLRNYTLLTADKKILSYPHVNAVW